MSEYTVVLAEFIAQCWRQILDLETVNIDNYSYEQFKVHHEVLCSLYLHVVEFQREVIDALCGERGNSSPSSSTERSGATSPPTDP